MAQSAAALFILAFAAAAAASVAQAASASEIAGVKNQLLPGRKLLAGDHGMIPITTDDLMPLSAGQAVSSGRAAGNTIQRELMDDADDWFPKDDFDKARSGVAGVQSQRELLGSNGMIPITTDDLMPLSAAEGLTKGRAGVVSLQKEL